MVSTHFIARHCNRETMNNSSYHHHAKKPKSRRRSSSAGDLLDFPAMSRNESSGILLSEAECPFSQEEERTKRSGSAGRLRAYQQQGARRRGRSPGRFQALPDPKDGTTKRRGSTGRLEALGETSEQSTRRKKESWGEFSSAPDILFTSQYLVKEKEQQKSKQITKMSQKEDISINAFIDEYRSRTEPGFRNHSMKKSSSTGNLGLSVNTSKSSLNRSSSHHSSTSSFASSLNQSSHHPTRNETPHSTRRRKATFGHALVYNPHAEHDSEEPPAVDVAKPRPRSRSLSTRSQHRADNDDSSSRSFHDDDLAEKNAPGRGAPARTGGTRRFKLKKQQHTETTTINARESPAESPAKESVRKTRKKQAKSKSKSFSSSLHGEGSAGEEDFTIVSSSAQSTSKNPLLKEAILAVKNGQTKDASMSQSSKNIALFVPGGTSSRASKSSSNKIVGTLKAATKKSKSLPSFFLDSGKPKHDFDPKHSARQKNYQWNALDNSSMDFSEVTFTAVENAVKDSAKGVAKDPSNVAGLHHAKGKKAFLVGIPPTEKRSDQKSLPLSSREGEDFDDDGEDDSRVQHVQKGRGPRHVEAVNHKFLQLDVTAAQTFQNATAV